MLVEIQQIFTLICDDVYTTGTSFREFIAENYPTWTMGHGISAGLFLLENLVIKKIL